MEKKPLLFITPLSDTLAQLHEVMTANAEKEGVELYEVEDMQEAGQVTGVIPPSLVIFNDPRKCIMYLAANRKVIKKKRSKVFLLTKKQLRPKAMKRFDKLGLTEYIKEPIAPKTLLYKVKLMLKSLPTQSDLDRENADDATELKHKEFDKNSGEMGEATQKGKKDPRTGKQHMEMDTSGEESKDLGGKNMEMELGEGDQDASSDNLSMDINPEDKEKEKQRGKALGLDVEQEEDGPLPTLDENGELPQVGNAPKLNLDIDEEEEKNKNLSLDISEEEKAEMEINDKVEDEEGEQKKEKLSLDIDLEEDPKDEGDLPELTEEGGPASPKLKLDVDLEEDKEEDLPGVSLEQENPAGGAKKAKLDIDAEEDDLPEITQEAEAKEESKGKEKLSLDIEADADEQEDGLGDIQLQEEKSGDKKEKLNLNIENDDEEDLPTLDAPQVEEAKREAKKNSGLDIDIEEEPGITEDAPKAKEQNKGKGSLASLDVDDDTDMNEAALANAEAAPKDKANDPKLSLEVDEDVDLPDITQEAEKKEEKGPASPKLSLDVDEEERELDLPDAEAKKEEVKKKKAALSIDVEDERDGVEREAQAQVEKEAKKKAKLDVDAEENWDDIGNFENHEKKDKSVEWGGEAEETERKKIERKARVDEEKEKEEEPESKKAEEVDLGEQTIHYDTDEITEGGGEQKKAAEEEDLGQQTINYATMEVDEGGGLQTEKAEEKDLGEQTINYETMEVAGGGLKTKKKKDKDLGEQTINYKNWTVDEQAGAEREEGPSQEEIDEMEAEEEKTFYPPRSQGIEIAIMSLRYFQDSSKNMGDILNYHSQLLFDELKAYISYFQFNPQTHKFSQIFSSHPPANENINWEAMKEANLLDWEKTTLPTWSDKRFEDPKIQFIYPYYDGPDCLGFAVVNFTEGVNESKAPYVELILENSRGYFLDYMHEITGHFSATEKKPAEQKKSGGLSGFFKKMVG